MAATADLAYVSNWEVYIAANDAGLGEVQFGTSVARDVNQVTISSGGAVERVAEACRRLPGLNIGSKFHAGASAAGTAERLRSGSMPPTAMAEASQPTSAHLL